MGPEPVVLDMQMPNPKYAAQLKNVYFLARIGESLRWATSDIAQEELPQDIQHLLRRLDRLERRPDRKRARDEDAN